MAYTSLLNPQNLIMLVATVLVLFGLLSSLRSKNMFAAGFSFFSLVVFLYVDFLIFKFAMAS